MQHATSAARGASAAGSASRRPPSSSASRPRRSAATWRSSSGPACFAACTAEPCPSAPWPSSSSGLGERTGHSWPSRRPGSPAPRRNSSRARTAASSSTAAPRPPRWPTCSRPTGACWWSLTRFLAARLANAPGITRYMLAVPVRGVTQCAVGEETDRKLADLRVDVAFLGTNGIAVGHGFTTPDEAEASVKHAMVRAGQRVIVLADSTKLNRETLVRFAEPEDVDVLDHRRRRRPGHPRGPRAGRHRGRRRLLSGGRPPRRRARCRRRRRR